MRETSNEGSEVTTDPKKVEEVRSLMSDIDVAMLTTVDSTSSDGRLTSRPLSTQVAEDDGDVLFLIRRSSSVADDVRAHPQVNVSYVGKHAWISLAGRGVLVEDRAEVERLWSRGAAMFMDGGPENPDNVVLRVEADTAHLWGGDSAVGTAIKTVRSALGASEEKDSTVVDLP